MPRTLAALLALTLAGPALAQGGAGNQTQGSGTTPSSQPTILPGTGGTAITPGMATESGPRGPANPGNAAAPGTVGAENRGTTGPLQGKEVTTGGSAAPEKR